MSLREAPRAFISRRPRGADVEQRREAAAAKRGAPSSMLHPAQFSAARDRYVTDRSPNTALVTVCPAVSV